MFRQTEVAHLHLDVKDASLLLNLLLDSSHGLVEDRQALCALQSGRGHHVARGCDQVDLARTSRIGLIDTAPQAFTLTALNPNQKHSLWPEQCVKSRVYLKLGSVISKI